MKPIFISIFLFSSLTIFCQDFGRIYIGKSQKPAERYLNKQIKRGQKKGNYTASTKSIVGDTLVYFLQNGIECMSIRMTFNADNKTKTRKLCDYQEILFECPQCAKVRLGGVIKSNKFEQRSENSYFAWPIFQSEMTIQYDSTTLDPIKLIYRPVDLPRLEYREQYKNLKQKNRTKR